MNQRVGLIDRTSGGLKIIGRVLFVSPLMVLMACDRPNEVERINFLSLECYVEPDYQAINTIVYTELSFSNDSVYAGGSLMSDTSFIGRLQLGRNTAGLASSGGRTSLVGELVDEGTEHQVFYSISDSLNLEIEYDDMDENGNPIGIRTRIRTGPPSTGQVTITVLHKPDKFAPSVALGDMTNAKGETDFSYTFDVTVE